MRRKKKGATAVVALLACICIFGSANFAMGDGPLHTMQAAVLDADGRLMPEATVVAYTGVGEPVRGEAIGDGTWVLSGLGEKAILHLSDPVRGTTSVEMSLPAAAQVRINIHWEEKSVVTRIVSVLESTPQKLQYFPRVSPNPATAQPKSHDDCPGDALFGQAPHVDEDPWTFGTSEVDANGSNYLRYENFSGISGQICDIHWWGAQLYNAGSWVTCTDSDLSFEVKFYADAGGVPGAVVCSQIVTPLVTDTGEVYGGFVPRFYYEAVLDPCCTITDGWVSIQGLGDIDCWFLWLSSGTGDGLSYFDDGTGLVAEAFDLSLCLTGVYVETYGACCDDYTGFCADGVEQMDCEAPKRFAANTSCAALDPPCGPTGACCTAALDCILTGTEADCDNAGGENWYEGEDCATFVCPASCEHSIVLTDDYGDGWNGGTVDVLVNGVLVLDDLTIATGAGPETYYFDAATDDLISTVYVPGSWAYENEYHIKDVNGNDVCADGTNGTQPTGGDCGPGYCGADPCEGNEPANDECVNATPVAGPYPQVVSGTNECATVDCPGVLDWVATWWAIDLPYAVNEMDISFCGNGFEINNVGVVYYNACDDCPNYQLYTAIDWYSCPDGITSPVITWKDVAGPTTVYFPVYFNGGQEVAYSIEIDVTEIIPPPNDFCEDAIPVAVPSVTAGWTTGGTLDPGYDCPGATITAPGVWYSVIGTGNTMLADLCNGATTWDTKLTVLCRGCLGGGSESDCCIPHSTPGCDDPVCEASVCSYDSYCCEYAWDSICVGEAEDDPNCPCGDDPGEGPLCVGGNDDYCGLQSGVEWCSQLGAEYLILVHGFSTATGDFELTISDDGVPCVADVICLPEGACCLLDGSCVIINEIACDSLGGGYEGDDTDCGIPAPGGKSTAEVPVPGPADAVLYWTFAESSGDKVDPTCPPGSLFDQPPTPATGGWTAGASDKRTGSGYSELLRYENFSGGGEICDIHFWGLSLSYPWAACNEDPMTFEIIFYNDDAGAPGTVACGPYTLAISRTDTGESWAGFPLYEYSAVLDPCCNMAAGWVSIQGVSVGSPDCWFLWASHGETGDGMSLLDDDGVVTTEVFDLSLCLTGVYVPIYGACCDDYTGDCADGVEQLDCEAPKRFVADTACADLDPPCGPTGACCSEDLECLFTDVEAACDAVEGTWYEGEDCSTFECPATCDHTIVLTDDYGDGWNGGTVDVLVNGVLVLDNLTIASGSGPETYVFPAATLDLISTVYVPGSWAYENEYHIYDIMGEEICADGVGGTQPVGGNCGAGNCELPEIQGACCLPDGTCVITIEACCEYAGGTYVGAGIGCGTGMAVVFSEDFNAGIPGDWTVLDQMGSGLIWDTNVYWGDPNWTGGDGMCAEASSDNFASAPYNTLLITPMIDLSGALSATVEFLANFQNFAGYDWFIVDVTYDGGATWSNLLMWNEDHGTFHGAPGEFVSLSIAGGSAMTQIRFRYLDPISHWNWEIQVDDFVITAEVEGLSPCQGMDIKPGSCPNSFNRGSNGVLPVALVGTEDFDVSMVDISSLTLSRADGIGGSTVPHEGPPGPHTVIGDDATPFDGVLCDCHELDGDGIDDLKMKFKTVDLVAALEMDDLDPGALVKLDLRGSLLDGTLFVASDCVRLVPPGSGGKTLSFTSTVSGTWLDIMPLDVTLDGGGFAPADRVHYEGTLVTIGVDTWVPPDHMFLGLEINGEMVGSPSTMSFEIMVDSDTTVRTIYVPQMVPKKKIGLKPVPPG